MLRGILATRAATGRLGVLLLAALLLCGAGAIARAHASERSLSFYNIHTKETTTVTYKRDGKYLREGLKRLNYVMRDWRQDEPTEMDPELLDLIWKIHRDLGSTEPIHLISGYRSEKTNKMLRRTRGGQAKKSQHILGKAADIHFPDVPLKTLRNSALVREVGGVGYYPKSGIPFVHVDTGRVRHWPRLPRMELAALFPDGKSKHIPSDGRPITIADARRAIESGRYAGPPEPVMVAAASVTRQASTDRPFRTAVLPAPKPAKASLATAGLGSDALGAFIRAAGITGSIPEPVAPPPGYQGSAMQFASISPAETMPLVFPSDEELLTAMRSSMPEVVEEPDDEHPEELLYAPFEVLPLMNDTPLSRETEAIALVAPRFDDAGYLLSQPERRLALEMKPSTGILHMAAAWHFEGTAVTDLRAPGAAPVAQPADPIMTASTPAPSVPMGGPVGFTGVGYSLR